MTEYTYTIIIHLRKHLWVRVYNTHFPFRMGSQKEVQFIDEVDEIIIIIELFYYPDKDCVICMGFLRLQYKLL